MPRCGRQDNVSFYQAPDAASRLLPNGEREKYTLEMKCKECEQGATITRATAKQCQWWLNIYRMKHDTCHVSIENGKVVINERTQDRSERPTY